MPAQVGLELTLRCPCKCQTCGSNAGRARDGELGQQEWLDVVGSLADLGCRRLSLLGGEPLLYPGWAELARAARGRGLLVDMVSSGMGVDAAVADRIRESGVHAVTISVDGLEVVHDRLRGVAGAFMQALLAIRLIDKVGLKVGVTTQVGPRNLDQLEEMAPVLEEAGVLGWQLQMTLPLGRACDDAGLVFAPSEMPNLLSVIRRMSQRAGLRPHLTDNIGYCSSDDTELRTIQGGFVRPWLGCRAGLDALGITSDGRVKGCLALPDSLVEGNVRQDSLASIWDDPLRFAYNRGYRPEQLGGACAECDQSKRCRGGCTAAAYALHGRPSISTHCFRLLPA
jgi:radical SAM protein with 4Fe4S-binding SPASM domain